MYKTLIICCFGLITQTYCFPSGYGVVQPNEIQLPEIGIPDFSGPINAKAHALNQLTAYKTAAQEAHLAAINSKVLTPVQPDLHVDEHESLVSTKLSAYENTHQKAAGFLNAQPVLDSTREEDKYGNSGDKWYPTGRAIVNGYEAFSNFLNRLVDKPYELVKAASRSLTSKLNDVGGKLVGLAK